MGDLRSKVKVTGDLEICITVVQKLIADCELLMISHRNLYIRLKVKVTGVNQFLLCNL